MTDENKDAVVLEDEQEVEIVEAPKKRLAFTPTTFLFGGIIGAILLALLVQFVLTPLFANNAAQDELDNLKNGRGPVVGINTSLVTFQGQKIENANVAQKALASGNVATTPAGFVFSNGKGNPKAKKVNVYLDFGNQRSRDFLLMNQNNLRGMIENGVIVLTVHPVPTGNAFTMYSSEALAESFVTSPEASWEFLMELMRMSATLKTDKQEDILKAIEETAKTVGVKNVDQESVKNGTFSSWIISVGNDPRLKVGYYPPLVYVNDQPLDSKLNLNDGDTLRREILKR